MVQDKLKELYERLTLIKKYQHALGIISFDFETITPEKAKEAEGDILNFFSNEIFKLANSDEYKQLIVYLHDNLDQVTDPLDKVLINKKYDEYLKEKNISVEFAEELSEAETKAFMDWYEARNKNDFSIFQGSLS